MGSSCVAETLELELTCPWCVAATIEVLAVVPQVERVRRRPGTCVLDITHTASPGEVIRTIAAIGASIEIGSRGEAVVLAATRPATRPCHRHPAPEIASATPAPPRDAPARAEGLDEVNAPTNGGPSRPALAPLDDESLADLVRHLADAVVICDRGGSIRFWNAAAERIFGWSADEVLGTSLDVIIPERLRGRHWAGYERVMASGQTSYGGRLLEVPALHRDGRTLSIAFTVSLLRDSDAEPVSGIAALIRDDTERWQERRRLREELDQLRSGAQDPIRHR